uniref:PGG domain-containing protein n=1 Tax=Leersia perrieri TaxID=77586 RepID=A0A0D9WD85_9ORYZ
MKMVDIGNNRSIEIPLRGKLVIQPQNDSRSGRDSDDDEEQGFGRFHKWLLKLLAGPDYDEDYLMNKRGWLMTGALQMPAWFPQDWNEVFQPDLKPRLHMATTITTSAGAPSPTSPDQQAIMSQANGVIQYIYFNTITFTVAMALLITLLMTKRSTAGISMRMATIVLWMLVFSTSITFIQGTSNDRNVTGPMLFTFAIFGFNFIFFCFGFPMVIKCMQERLKRRRDLRRAARGRLGGPEGDLRRYFLLYTAYVLISTLLNSLQFRQYSTRSQSHFVIFLDSIIWFNFCVYFLYWLHVCMA